MGKNGRTGRDSKSHSQILSKKKVLEGRKVIVTAGPCREPLDPVRFISNRSSGKMGFALAQQALEAGAEVTLVSGPTALAAPSGLNFMAVETTAQMYEAIKGDWENCDILIMAAAPADFTAAEISPLKIKKSDQGLNLNLTPALDILASLHKIKKPRQKIIGFALETDNAEFHAREKLRKKGLDMIVLNELGEQSPFDSDQNQVTLFYGSGEKESLGRMSKTALAEKLIMRIAGL